MGVTGRRHKKGRHGGKVRGVKAEAPFSRAELQAVGALMHGGSAAAEAAASLRILPASPWRMHAHWSVPDAAWQAARAQLPAGGETVPVLRFFDFTPLSATAPRPHPPFDVAVDGTAGSRIVDVWKDGKTYVAELGLRGGDHFVGLARSPSVELPVAGPSDEAEEEWRPVLRPDFATDRAAPVAGREAVIDRLPPESFRPLLPQRVEIPPDPPPLPAPPPVVAAPDSFPHPESFPQVEPADDVAAAAGRAEAAAVAQAAALGGDNGLAAELDGGAPFVHPSAADESGAWSDGGALPPNSVVTLSSFSLTTPADLEIRADLVVYGRTRPGATLSLFGRPVAVAADGTFSVRRPLPQGALVLPLTLDLGDGGDNGEGS